MKPEALIATLAALNGYLAAGEAAYALGKTIITALKGMGGGGVLPVEAQAEVKKFRALLDAAAKKNTDWLDTHPAIDN